MGNFCCLFPYYDPERSQERPQKRPQERLPNPFLGQMTINSGLPSGKKFLSFEVNNTLQKHLDCMFPENILCIAIGSELEEESVRANLANYKSYRNSQ